MPYTWEQLFLLEDFSLSKMYRLRAVFKVKVKVVQVVVFNACVSSRAREIKIGITEITS